MAATGRGEDRGYRTGSALMASLLDLLEERPGDAETIAVYSGDREVSRAALRAAAQDLASTLTAAGVKPGQPVAVMLENGPEVVAAMFGVWYAGAVYVPINPRVTASELDHYLTATRPALLIARAAPADVTVPAVIAGELSWTPPPAPAADVPAHEGDIALVQWTSGTTGRPKPVLLRHSGFLKLLEPVLKKLLGAGQRQDRRAQGPDAQPDPDLDGAFGRHLQRALRLPRRRRRDPDGALRPDRLLRARAALPVAFHGAAAGGDDDALRHPRSDDARAAEVRAQHQRAAVAAAGAPVSATSSA